MLTSLLLDAMRELRSGTKRTEPMREIIEMTNSASVSSNRTTNEHATFGNEHVHLLAEALGYPPPHPNGWWV